MDPEVDGQDPIKLLKSLEMNPQKFKSFYNRFINERIIGTGLTESQAIFLVYVDHEKGKSLKELTERVGVHKSLTTRIVKALVEDGFIVNNTESGKEYSIILTKKGESAKKVIAGALDELLRLVLRDLTEDETMSLYRIVYKIRTTMIELSEDPTDNDIS